MIALLSQLIANIVIYFLGPGKVIAILKVNDHTRYNFERLSEPIFQNKLKTQLFCGNGIPLRKHTSFYRSITRSICIYEGDKRIRKRANEFKTFETNIEDTEGQLSMHQQDQPKNDNPPPTNRTRIREFERRDKIRRAREEQS